MAALSAAASEPSILLDWTDAQLVEWDFRHALKLTQEAGCAVEPLLYERPPIVVHGRHCRQPRDVAFFSDESVGYFYSRQVMRSQPLSDPLKALLALVNSTLSAAFNGILVNRYRTGKDTVGAHSDSEYALEVSAGVVALSLGTTRKFRLRSKATHAIVGDYDAREGYALQMRGARFQSLLEHEIPTQARVKQPRLSFTFRKHRPEQEQGLVDLLRKQELREDRKGRSRSPRRRI
jgi:alkylated DNA repair dioxygenase AlkB